jgi:hypothetical protein
MLFMLVWLSRSGRGELAHNNLLHMDKLSAALLIYR